MCVLGVEEKRSVTALAMWFVVVFLGMSGKLSFGPACGELSRARKGKTSQRVATGFSGAAESVKTQRPGRSAGLSYYGSAGIWC